MKNKWIKKEANDEMPLSAVILLKMLAATNTVKARLKLQIVIIIAVMKNVCSMMQSYYYFCYRFIILGGLLGNQINPEIQVEKLYCPDTCLASPAGVPQNALQAHQYVYP